jgi:hydroxypyruvate isomerase
MLRVAANISMLFTDAPFLDRVERAARAGFEAVECQFPYEVSAGELRLRLDDHGLALVLHNLPPGDWTRGERGIACHPDRIDEFESGVQLAIEYASALGCRQLNCLAGLRPEGIATDTARATLVRNLTYAAERAEAAGIRLLLEPINTRDMPGYLVSRTADALGIIREAGTDNLFLQYDCYHMEIMEGDLVHTIEVNLDAIGHIQVADPPHRGEPGTGVIDFPSIFRLLDRLGYNRWIGAEYVPLGRTEDGLGWMRILSC